MIGSDAEPVLYFDFSLVPVVESAKPEHTPQPELADQPKVVPAEETPTPELTTPAPQQPEAENNKGTQNTCFTHSNALVCELGMDLQKHADS